MNANRTFVDTNLVVYAYDASAGPKHARARAVLEELWNSRNGCISVQVLQEFFVTVTRKVPKPLAPSAAAVVIADLSRWQVHAPGPDDILAAIDLHASSPISFWHAMIVRSAAALRCDVLYTEDLNSGQDYGGVRVVNPLA